MRVRCDAGVRWQKRGASGSPAGDDKNRRAAACESPMWWNGLGQSPPKQQKRRADGQSGLNRVPAFSQRLMAGSAGRRSTQSAILFNSFCCATSGPTSSRAFLSASGMNGAPGPSHEFRPILPRSVTVTLSRLYDGWIFGNHTLRHSYCAFQTKVLKYPMVAHPHRAAVPVVG